MKLKTGSRATTVLVGGLGLALLGGGAAYAHWSTTGSGNGSAAATTSQGLQVAATAPVSNLYPGATNVAGGSIDVTNPNPFAVTITTKGFSSVSVDAAHSGCATLGVITYGFGATQPTTIPANGGKVAIPFTVSMATTAADACQGASFTSTLTVNGQSA